MSSSFGCHPKSRPAPRSRSGCHDDLQPVLARWFPITSAPGSPGLGAASRLLPAAISADSPLRGNHYLSIASKGIMVSLDDWDVKMGQVQQHRSLWQLLMIVSTPEELANLSCEECYTLFELLADETYQDLENPRLRKLMQDHFNFCPDCRLYYENRLDELEAGLATRRTAGDPNSS